MINNGKWSIDGSGDLVHPYIRRETEKSLLNEESYWWGRGFKHSFSFIDYYFYDTPGSLSSGTDGFDSIHFISSVLHKILITVNITTI